jgi:serine/threonine protein phosphatase PrpC
VLVCSDGLWNYYETPASLRELVAAGPPGETVLETARRLVDAALEAGGHDNITVAVKSLGAPSWAAEGEAGATEAEPVEAVPTAVEAVEAVPAEAEAEPDPGAAEPLSETPTEAPPEIESHESEE